MRPRLWWVLAQGAILAVVAYFVTRAFVRQWSELGELGVSLAANPGLIALAALVIWIAYVGLIIGWVAVLRGMGARLSAWSGARIWSVSSLGKYVPGKVWALAGMVVLAQRAGVRPLVATGGALVMQLLALGTGGALVATTGASTLTDVRPELRLGLLILLAACVLGTGFLLHPRWFSRLVARLPGQGDGPVVPPTPATIAIGLGANIGAWAAYGLAVWLLAGALVPETAFPLAGTIGAFTAAYIVGFLVLFIPGGLGVREGVFVLMLQGSVGLAAATGVAVASRVLFTATEVGIALPFLFFPKGETRGTS